jgi:hypothetical protein
MRNPERLATVVAQLMDDIEADFGEDCELTAAAVVVAFRQPDDADDEPDTVRIDCSERSAWQAAGLFHAGLDACGYE